MGAGCQMERAGHHHNVRPLFESLFSDQPAACRKLHNIANSVVLFDEAQSLPADLTSVTLRAVNELCSRYHTTMVFSTATQPDFSARKT